MNVSVVEPLSPSVTLGELIDSVGLSSSLIVAVPVTRPDPSADSLAATMIVSSLSSRLSWRTWIWFIVLLTSPAAKVSHALLGRTFPLAS